MSVPQSSAASFRPGTIPTSATSSSVAASKMASAGTAATAGPSTTTTVQSFTVRNQKNTKKLYNIMKFPGAPMDFSKSGSVKMERENNYKDFRLAHDIDILPKFGAGSEFGRQQRDEARRKKYGMATRKYNPYQQPWLMRVGNGKTAKKFKGTKEGGVTENTSYFMFMQSPDGAFEACPVDEWYSFNPTIKYKYLNSEEAEEEFSRRDKNLNLRSIMLKKRLKGEEGLDEEENLELSGRKAKKPKKDRSGLKLTEMEDWADDDEDSADGSDGDGSDSGKKKKSKDAPKKRRNRGGKANSDEEACEESDDMNEGVEVDYMTSSDSEEDMMFDQDKQRDKDTYEEKGVAEEQGLLTLIDSGAEEEEEEDKKDENEDEEEEEEEKKEKKSKQNGSDTESSSSSESDSDADEPNVQSALFLGPRKTEKAAEKAEKAEKKKKRRPSLSSEGSAATNSRSATPSVDQGEDSCKRSATDSPVPKKPRLDTPTLPPGATEGITEESVRRYLMRKPMTTKDILQKFRSKKTGLSNEQMVNAITQVLKRLNPEKHKIKDKLYLSIKKT